MFGELLITNKEKMAEIFNFYINKYPLSARILIKNFEFKRINKIYYQQNKIVSLSGTQQKKLRKEVVCFIELMYNLVELEEGVDKYLKKKEEKLLFLDTVSEIVEAKENEKGDN